MKKTLFILAALSCSFGGLGDLVRPLYDKDYKAMYSREHNLKEFVAGGCYLSVWGFLVLICK